MKGLYRTITTPLAGIPPSRFQRVTMVSGLSRPETAQAMKHLNVVETKRGRKRKVVTKLAIMLSKSVLFSQEKSA